MSRKIWWHEFSAPEFQSIDPMKTIALMPIAAVEQHGPHLPVGTDAILNLGCIEEMIPRVPAAMDLRILPVQTAGKSNEHLWQKGTVTHTAATLIEAWTEIGLSVARAGIKKLAMVNSHGGNEEVMGIVARELRVRAGMLVVKTGWTRFQPPAGLITDDERRLGIHGGDLETSLMLHFRPELADMSKAENFRSSAAGRRGELQVPAADRDARLCVDREGPEPAWRRRRCLDRDGREGREDRGGRSQRDAGAAGRARAASVAERLVGGSLTSPRLATASRMNPMLSRRAPAGSLRARNSSANGSKLNGPS